MITGRDGSQPQTPSSSGAPSVTGDDNAAMLWLERKPQDFIRAFRKSRSEPALQLPQPGKGAPKGEKKKVRRGEVRASDIISAQQAADDAKKAKDLIIAERTADLVRREHSILVAEKVKKTAKLAELARIRADLDDQVAQSEGAGNAMHDRLAALEREDDELDTEVGVEEAATPRYEYMLKRTREDSVSAQDRCARPQREIEKILGEMRRCGDSHISAALDAESAQAAVEREKAYLARRRQQFDAFLGQLNSELAGKEESKNDIRMIMTRRHDDSLQLAGDKSAEEEASLERSASNIGAQAVGAGGQRFFTKEHALELEANFLKLSNFFGVTTTEELVAKVLRYHSSSASDKAEALQADIDAARAKQEALSDEQLELSKALETTRFVGEGSSPGYLLFSPRGETLLAHGGSEEVTTRGDAILEAQSREELLRNRVHRGDELLKAAAEHTEVLLNVTACIAEQQGARRRGKARAGGPSFNPDPLDVSDAQKDSMGDDDEPPPPQKRIVLAPEQVGSALEALTERLLWVTHEYAGIAPHIDDGGGQTTMSQPQLAAGGEGAAFEMDRIVEILDEFIPFDVPSWSTQPSTEASLASSRVVTPRGVGIESTALGTKSGAKGSEKGARARKSGSQPNLRSVSRSGSQQDDGSGHNGNTWSVGSIGRDPTSTPSGLLPPVPGALGSISTPSIPARGRDGNFSRGRSTRRPTTDDVLTELSRRGLGSDFFNSPGGPPSIASVVQAQMLMRNAKDSKNIRIALENPMMTFMALADESLADIDEEDSRPTTAGEGAPPSRGTIRAGRAAGKGGVQGGAATQPLPATAAGGAQTRGTKSSKGAR